MIEEGKVHELKCWPEPFEAMWKDLKTCEVRKNDRDFKVGDILHLREFSPDMRIYLGRGMVAHVLHIQTGFGLPEDVCVMSVVVTDRHIEDEIEVLLHGKMAWLPV